MDLNLNIKHLEYFLTVAQAGSINKAAQALYISQPYLGKLITDLENDLGTVLMQRTRSGIILTPDGERFLSGAEAVVREARKLRTSFSQPALSPAPLIVSCTKWSHIMDSFIHVVQSHGHEPAFSHQLKEGSTEEVIDDVFSGQANVGVIHFDSRKSGEVKENLAAKGLAYHFISQVVPHIIRSGRHPLIRDGKPVTLENLAPYGLVRYTGQYEDFSFQINCGSSYYNLNRSPKIVYLSDRASLLHLISESDFYSIGIHDFSGQRALYDLISVPVEGCSFMLEFGYLLPAGTAVNPVTEEFLSEVEKRLTSL